MIKGNKYVQFVLAVGLMHQHTLDILFHFESDIAEVHSFSELEESVVLHAKLLQSDARQKNVILALFEAAGFICHDPCKYFLLLSNFIDRTWVN